MFERKGKQGQRVTKMKDRERRTVKSKTGTVTMQTEDSLAK